MKWIIVLLFIFACTKDNELKEENPMATLVTTVTVTGAGDATTITTDRGTLQMSAHIDPHDATNQTVVWMIINGTGTGAISTTGLLSAFKNGIITIRAISTDRYIWGT